MKKSIVRDRALASHVLPQQFAAPLDAPLTKWPKAGERGVLYID
jgi:hypothetical protein